MTTPLEFVGLDIWKSGAIWLTEFLVDKNQKLKDDEFDTMWQQIVTCLAFDRSETTGFMRFTMLIYTKG